MKEPTALKTFRGDLAWIHAREGHAGRPYWPGGESGVTLDPGFDLGYSDRNQFRRLYSDLLTREQIRACDSVFGKKAASAQRALRTAGPELKSIRISREQAHIVFPHCFAPYWSKLCQRWPQLEHEDVPGPVHTAVASIGYNRGPYNSRTGPIGDELEEGIQEASSEAWRGLANLIAGMQQNHQLKGIRKRRRMEARLIAEWIGDQEKRLERIKRNRKRFMQLHLLQPRPTATLPADKLLTPLKVQA